MVNTSISNKNTNTLSNNVSSYNITSKIRERRETLNYTQAYVAGKLGISQNAYSKIESGQTNFTVKRLFEIVKILESSIADFLY